MKGVGELRSIRDDELDLMRSWRNHPSIRANMYTRHEIGVEEHRAWWESTRQRSDRKYFMYEVSGVAAGIVGFTAIDQQSRNACWAFYAAPDAPRGTGSRMEFLALEYAFHDLKLNKLYCEVLAFNVPVIKLHKKFGFQEEGIFRQQHRVDNDFVDVHRLGILASEWAALRSTMSAKIIAIS